VDENFCRNVAGSCFSLSPSKKIDPTAKQTKSIYHFLLGEKKIKNFFMFAGISPKARN
jgi:hypothetical protein